MRPLLKPAGISEIQDVNAAATVMVEANTCSTDRNTGWTNLTRTMRASPKIRTAHLPTDTPQNPG